MWQEICYYHICGTNLYVFHMPNISYMYQLHHVQIWDSYGHIYASYEPISNNNETKNSDIHTFHITDICPWRNIPKTLHIHILLPFSCILYRTHITAHNHQKSIMHNIYLPCYLKVHATNKYAPQMPKICHIPKLLDMHLYCSHQWGSQNCCPQMIMMPANDKDNIMTMIPHSDSTDWVGHLAKSAKMLLVSLWMVTDVRKLLILRTGVDKTAYILLFKFAIFFYE